MTERIDISHLRTWIGSEHVASDLVSPELVHRLRATLDQTTADLRPGNPAPRLIHFCLGPPAAPMSELGPDGHPARGGFLPPVPLPRRMWAGGAFTFHREISVGDMVRRTSRVSDVVVKEGRTGPLCFVTVAHRIEVDGTAAIEERQDIVYREADTGAPGKAPPPAERGMHRREVGVSSTLLFRYSALTFNGHRIHYDRRYATDVENYPGLVVHGPIQATWLQNFATEIRGSAPAFFSFRSLTALFDDDRVFLHAADDGERLKLWTARDGGPVAMMAEASWS